VGDELYLDVGGALTNVRPATPIYVGSAIEISVSSGVIFVNPDCAGGGGGVGGWQNITLWHNGTYTEYAFTEAGLIAANAAAVSGDVVFITAGTISLTAAITIIAGVKWLGQSREKTILSGSGNIGTFITMNANSVLQDMTIDLTNNDGQYNVYGISSTEGYLRNINITLTTDNYVGGRGDFITVNYTKLPSVANTTVVAVENCSISVIKDTSDVHSKIIALKATEGVGEATNSRVILRELEIRNRSTEGDAWGIDVDGSTDTHVILENIEAIVEEIDNDYFTSTYYGINMNLASIHSCNVIVDVNDCTNAYGIMFNGRGNIFDADVYVETGDLDDNTDICPALYGLHYADDRIEGSTFICTGTDGVYVGAQCAGDADGWHTDCIFVGDDYGFYEEYDDTLIGCFMSGATADIYVDTSRNLNVYACQYDSTAGAGTLVQLIGDRARLTGDNVFTAKRTDTPEEITATSAGVAASLAMVCTEVTTNGDADLDNVTLANGISGQLKHIYCVVLGNVGDTWKITPATMCGGTQITFSAGTAGEGCILRYADNEGWVVVGNNGGVIT
jgi:hypothetical protein